MTSQSCAVRSSKRLSDLLPNTCLLATEVRQLAEANGLRGGSKSSPMELLRRLHEFYGTSGPGHERDWLKKCDKAKRILGSTAYPPEHPKEWERNPREWLSNFDIEFVLSQYESQIGDDVGFQFVGSHPSDFSDRRGATCISEPLCNLRISDLAKKGVHQVGIVFNTDKHSGPGEHWTACFVGIDPTEPARYGCFYYDSTGKRPFASAEELMKRLQKEAAEERLPELPLLFNPIQKQFQNTECGIYALSFTISMLVKKDTFEDICINHMDSDNNMHKLRQILFRPPDRR